jgi:hypothetical protein
MDQTTKPNCKVVEELSEFITALLISVRRLPPGPERYDALKQIGLFQVRLDKIAALNRSLKKDDEL